MIHRPALGIAFVVAVVAAGCCCPPEDMKQKTPEGPQFDAAYYAKNAKEYFDQGHYGQAKDQWQKQLTKDPDNWMARLGVASCDLYLSEESVVRNRDLDEARKRVTAAEKGFKELWGGQLEPDTQQADPKRPQWRAAILLALTWRTMGYIDHLDSQRNLDLAKRGGPEAIKAANRSAELDISRDQHYGESIDLFNRLAYMGHASPEAIKNLAELYVVTKKDALAEQEFRRYLEIAGRSSAQWEEEKKSIEKRFAPGTAQEMASEIYDAKLASSAQKQVSVLVDLASLAWARADYPAVRQYIQEALQLTPERKDLYLKLAEAEQKLDMLETALMNVDQFLKRSSQKREEFDDDIRHALKMRTDIEKTLRERRNK
jgi:tetratricopeptide (TPR) repeat protein